MTTQPIRTKVQSHIRELTPSRARFEHLAGITLLTTYLLMVIGAYTSAVGAGLSCPDWPTCYGTIVPFLHPDIVANSPYSAGQIFVEWAHRGVAMVVGVLIFTTVGAAWIGHREQPIVVKAATLAGLLLPVQVILGGLTVTQALQPIIVTAHLGIALLILLSLTAATVMAWCSE